SVGRAKLVMPQRVISQKPTAETGQAIETRVTVERALTIFLNSQEIVTAMTINDYPEYLALGYLLARSVAARLSPIGNRRNPPPRAENAANFFGRARGRRVKKPMFPNTSTTFYNRRRRHSTPGYALCPFARHRRLAAYDADR